MFKHLKVGLRYFDISPNVTYNKQQNITEGLKASLSYVEFKGDFSFRSNLPDFLYLSFNLIKEDCCKSVGGLFLLQIVCFSAFVFSFLSLNRYFGLFFFFFFSKTLRLTQREETQSGGL